MTRLMECSTCGIRFEVPVRTDANRDTFTILTAHKHASPECNKAVLKEIQPKEVMEWKYLLRGALGLVAWVGIMVVLFKIGLNPQ